MKGLAKTEATIFTEKIRDEYVMGKKNEQGL